MSGNPGAQDALNRMKRAHVRGTGCHLTPDMIEGLGRTFLAEIWEEADPRAHLTDQEGQNR